MAKTKAKWIYLDNNSLQDDGSGNVQVFLEAGAGLESTAAGLRIKAGEVTDAMLAGSISFSKLADNANIARLDQAESVGAVWDFGVNIPTASGDPTADNELVRKAYVDAVASGLSVKDPVRVATTGPLPGSPSYYNGLSNDGVGAILSSTSGGTSLNTVGIDGLTDLAVGEKILVKDQVNLTENGMYEVSTVGVDATTEYVLNLATNDVGGRIYVSQQIGDDSNDGRSAVNPVRTIKRAWCNRY